MVAEAGIRSATSEDIVGCIRTLTRAFQADPVCCWSWPDPAVYRDAFPVFCRAFGGAAFASGRAHVTQDGDGAALWLAPGTAPDEQALVELIRTTAAPSTEASLFSLFEQMGAYHPHEPHWHLPLIGVDPDGQGRGIGSALLRHGLALCDGEGLLAYLEATSEANRRLYERHGFESIGLVQAGDSPPIIPMTRKPRSG
jgi:ribosomal protein S18 acetylase RimI-like enzyme